MSVHSEQNRDQTFFALENLPTVKRRICELLDRHATGCTRHEIAAELGMPLSSVCGRVKELEGDGWVFSTEETRQTPHGKTATVVCLRHREKPVQLELF